MLDLKMCKCQSVFSCVHHTCCTVTVTGHMEVSGLNTECLSLHLAAEHEMSAVEACTCPGGVEEFLY